MGAVEDRLAELGLSVPDVAKPVASYVPAVRTGTSSTPPASCRCAPGELMTTGKVGGEVTPEEAAACAQQCALNAIAAVKAEIGDLDAVKRVVKVVCFVASDAGLHRPAAGRQRRLRPVRQGLRRRRRARALGRRRTGAAAGRPGRGRDHRRGLSRAGVRCRHSWSSTRGSSPTGRRTPAEPRDAATVILMRPGPTRCGPELYLLRRQTSMAFAGGMCVFPGGGVDPRDFDHAVAWAGPAPSVWADQLLHVRGDGAGPGVRRGARDVRGVGRAARRPSAAEVVADTTGDDWEADRQALEAKELSFTVVPRPARARAAHRPARRLGGMVHAGVRAAALPHLVLRRRAAARPAHARRLERVVDR